MKYLRPLLLFMVALLMIGCVEKKEYPLPSIEPCQNAEDKFDCIAMKGIEENNPLYCEFISEGRNKCYKLLAIRAKDFAFCHKITDAEETRDCKIVISYDKKDMSACLQYSYDDTPQNWDAGRATKQMCQIYIKGQARIGKDVVGAEFMLEECKKVIKDTDDDETQKRKLNSCYYGAALTSNDLSVCDLVTGDLMYYCNARVLARSEE